MTAQRWSVVYLSGCPRWRIVSSPLDSGPCTCPHRVLKLPGRTNTQTQFLKRSPRKGQSITGFNPRCLNYRTLQNQKVLNQLFLCFTAHVISKDKLPNFHDPNNISSLLAAEQRGNIAGNHNETNWNDWWSGGGSSPLVSVRAGCWVAPEGSWGCCHRPAAADQSSTWHRRWLARWY